MPKSLLQMLGASAHPNRLSESALIVVDAQKEYTEGKLPLVGVDGALQQIQKLLRRAREHKTKVFFIRHRTVPGAPIFDPDGPFFSIVDELAPAKEEWILDKSHPSSFSGTTLHDNLQNLGLKNLIVTGFMTHACISTTVRAGSDLGYNITVVDEACATRDLASGSGSIVSAAEVHTATMAALGDLFATVAESADSIPD